MKWEKLSNGIVAVILAFLIAFGSVGCLTSGFGIDFPGAQMACWYLCVIALGAVCFSRGWGIWLLGVGALAIGYLWHRNGLTDQLFALTHILTTRYDNAYGIGVYGSPGKTGELFALMGALIGSWVVYAVCCRKGSTLAVFFGLLPMALCLVVTDTVPEEGYLYCLLYGVIMVIMTSHARQQEETQGVRLSAMLALPLAAALGLMFWLVPQEGYDKHPEEVQIWLMEQIAEMPETFGDLSDQFAGQLGITPEPEDVDLTKVGPMRQYGYAVMEVCAPQSGVVYLREQDYDQYTGKGWVSTEDREEAFAPGEGWPAAGEITITTRWGRSVYALPYYPEGDTDLVSGSAVNEELETTYSFTQQELPADWHDRAVMPIGADMPIVHADGTRFDGEELKYLGLPRTTREGLGPILSQFLSGEYTATQIADAVADYVQSSAAYDLDTAAMPQDEDDFALWFLRSSDTGYCVHFATATAVLLRSAGVESRYVTGYMVTVEAGEPVTVTAEDAHAWVEYYEPRLDAWIVLEPTPEDDHEEETRPPQTRPTQEVETTQPTTPTQTTPTKPEAPQETPEQRSWTWIWAVVLGGAAVLYLPVRRWVILSRREKAKKLPANQYGLKLWERCEELANALDAEPPKELEDIAQKARFSQHTLSGQELAALEGYVTEAIDGCRKKPLHRHLLYQYWYVLY